MKFRKNRYGSNDYCSKIEYATRQEAKEAAKTIYKVKGFYLKEYKCSRGDHWHLTSQRQR